MQTARASSTLSRAGTMVVLALAFALGGARPAHATACGSGNYPFPFTDVGGVADTFCLGILEAYVTGISRGTTPTTFSPDALVPRVQMTTFLQRALDQGLKRSSRRAALQQFWTTRLPASMQRVDLPGQPRRCVSDGESIWVLAGSEVIRVHASSGVITGTWTGFPGALEGIVYTPGRIYVTRPGFPASELYGIDATTNGGSASLISASLGETAVSIAFDGSRLWTANRGGSVSVIDAGYPYGVFTVSTGFGAPLGVVYDGANVWVTDTAFSAIHRLDTSGAIVQTVPLGAQPRYPIFDGANLWVPSETANNVAIVSAASGSVIATIAATAGNGLNQPQFAAFDGERVLVTNAANPFYVSVFKAADSSDLGASFAPALPTGMCSDGIGVWFPTGNPHRLWRM